MDSFVLSQIVIGIAICFDILSFQFKDRKKVLICLLISCILIGTHFILLQQWTATGLAFLAIFRYLVCLKTTSKAIMWIFIALSVTIAAVTYGGVLSIISCLGSIFGAAGAFSKKDKQLRQFMFIGTALWLLNNILLGSPAAVLMETLFLGSNIVGYYRFYMKPHFTRKLQTTPPVI